jgi:hypothetical protein
MKSKGELIFNALAILVLLLVGGYFAWQTQQITQSMNRIAVSQEETSKEVKTSQKRMEEQIRKLSKGIRLPRVKEWVQAVKKPLAAEAKNVMREAQKQGMDDAFRSWSEKIRQREDKRHQNLLEKLSENRKEIKKQYVREKELRQDLIKKLREDREADKKRWLKLTETLKQNRENDRKEYRAIVQRLNEERDKALEKTKQLEEERKREISKLLDQAKEIEKERKRQMSEFCARRPESAICR